MSNAQLKHLIARKDRLEAELRQIERHVQEGIREFSRNEGYLFPLRIEKVRPMVGL